MAAALGGRCPPPGLVLLTILPLPAFFYQPQNACGVAATPHPLPHALWGFASGLVILASSRVLWACECVRVKLHYYICFCLILL